MADKKPTPEVPETPEVQEEKVAKPVLLKDEPKKVTTKVEEPVEVLEPVKVELYNTTRHVIPVMLNKGGKLTQVNVFPKKSIKVLPEELTESVYNLTDTNRRELIVK